MLPRRIPLLHGSQRHRAAEYHGIRIADGWYPPGLRLGLHRHERPGFGVVIEGALEIAFSNRRRDGTPGCFGAEPLDEAHSNVIGRQGVHIIAFEITAERLGSCGSAARFLLDGEACRHPAAVAIARRAAAEIGQPDSASGLVVEASLLELLAIAARRNGSSANGGPPWLDRAQDFLHARFLDPLTTADVAEAAGVHPMHLARTFRERFRTSVGLYVRALRLDWAARRLAATDDPISQIALEGGFADQSHFTRRFREHAGMTPGQYRRAHGASEHRGAANDRRCPPAR